MQSNLSFSDNMHAQGYESLSELIAMLTADPAREAVASEIEGRSCIILLLAPS